MTKKEFKSRVDSVINQTKDALQLIWDNLNNGQQKKLLKKPEVEELLRRYKIIQ